jgi:hypothetical protein
VSEDELYDDDLIEQLNSLPVPDEDSAWGDMEKLLDKERDKTLVAPPARNARVWIAVSAAVVLIAILWLFVLPKRTEDQPKNNVTEENKDGRGNRKDTNSNSTAAAGNAPQSTDSLHIAGIGDTSSNASASNNKVQTEQPGAGKQEDKNNGALKVGNNTRINRNAKSGNNNQPAQNQPATSRGEISQKGGNTGRQPVIVNDNSKKGSGNKNNSLATGKPAGNKPHAPKKNDNIVQQENKHKENNAADKIINNPNTANAVVPAKPSADKQLPPKTDQGNKIAQAPGAPTVNGIRMADSINARIDSNKKNNIVAADTPKAGPAKPVVSNSTKFHVSLGMSEQQAVRLDCHCAYPENIYSDAPEVKDYIPSVYVRLYPSNKIFIQAEAKFALPQYVEEQLYKANVQTQPLNITTTSYVLKKVYYTQLPISVNYNILPNWSAGLGVAYNIFSQGVSQVDVRKKIFGSGTDSLISSNIIKGRNDSAFSGILKNNFQAFIESEYRLQHFSFGARYALGLQPYISYVDPFTHKLAEKKNQSLQFFIRFELWDSNRKKK